jgi:hypothetical protein
VGATGRNTISVSNQYSLLFIEVYVSSMDLSEEVIASSQEGDEMRLRSAATIEHFLRERICLGSDAYIQSYVRTT